MNNNERAKNAIANYLMRGNYDIKERDWKHDHESVDFICKDLDSNELVFADVHVCEGQDFERENFDADRFERLAIAYLATCEETDILVRYDYVSLVIISRDRAFVKHHVNASKTFNC